MTGKFSVDEIRAVMDAVCSYAKAARLTKEDILDLCSLSANELPAESKNAWCTIAESLPNRSVQSIHNFCRRRFNPNNYSGKWPKEEVEALMDLVEKMGSSWKQIARTLNDQFNPDSRMRTAENVKDKYKQVGGSNHQARVVGNWTLKEELKLIKAVQKATQVVFFNGDCKVKFKVDDS